jgi:teichoic acid transport system ATP-binding protein
MARKPLLILDDVSHFFEHKLQSGGANIFERLATKIFGRKQRVKALREINLSLYEGEIVGIIGRSGAGKSTLGDVMSGLLHPTTGTVFAQENPQLLSGFGNFLPKLSGARNIALILAAHGVSDNDIETLLPQIIKRAKIRKIVHQPMNTYTKKARQKVRGALALTLLPRILIADTPLKAGDKERTQELREELLQVAQAGGLVVLAGQRLEVLEQMCTRIIWLEKGTVLHDGTSAEIVSKWRERYSNDEDEDSSLEE